MSSRCVFGEGGFNRKPKVENQTILRGLRKDMPMSIARMIDHWALVSFFLVSNHLIKGYKYPRGLHVLADVYLLRLDKIDFATGRKAGSWQR